MPRAKRKNEELTIEEMHKQAFSAYKAEQWDAAIRLYRRIIASQNRADGKAYYRLGRVYVKVFDYDKAIECYQKAIDTPGYEQGNVWNSMGIAYGDKGDYDKAIECFQKAIDTPGYDSPGDSWCNMSDAYRDICDYDKAIECYQKAIDTPGYEQGNVWNSMGIAYGDKGDYDKAIECFQKAIDTPGYDTPGSAWHNMGIAYEKKNHPDEAIKCYQKAIDTPGYEHGSAWNNIGNIYLNKGDYDKAIECYEHAIDIPAYKPSAAWYNMGIAYYSKGDYHTAIECYQKAADTPEYHTPGYVWHNMGLAYHALLLFEQAIDAYTQAATWFRSVDRVAEAEASEARIVMVRAVQKFGKATAGLLYPALSAAQSLDDSNDTYDPRVELETLEGETMRKADEYTKLYLERDNSAFPQNAVVFLKGWSSSEPFFAGGSHNKRTLAGGGMLLRWNGKGAVVDPGINYLTNLHGAGYFVHDIDALIVTHDHVDHTFDIDAVDDLIYKTAVDSGGRKRFCFFSAEFEKRRSDWSKKPKTLYKVASAFNDRDDNHFERNDRQIIPGISFIPFGTRHSDCSFGLVCIFENNDGAMRIGTTSDTSYFSALPKYMANCDLIVAHMSSPDAKEYADPNYIKRKANHLGLNGTRKLIENTNAQVYVITEFWAGLGDRRIPLCQKLAYDLEKESSITNKCIIPADIGLTIHLGFENGKPCLKIPCTSCGTPASPRLVKCQDITVVRPDKPYGSIRYLCPDCINRLTIPMLLT